MALDKGRWVPRPRAGGQLGGAETGGRRGPRPPESSRGVTASGGGQQEPARRWEGATPWGDWGAARRCGRNGRGLALSVCTSV